MPHGPESSTPLLVSAALVWWRDALVVQRRPADARHGAGMLEFPGGKLEPGESPRAALARELVEEWGPAAAQLEVGRVAEVLHHRYPPPGPEVLLMVFHVDASAWGGLDPRPRLALEPGASVEIVAVDALAPDDFLAADRRFVGDLRDGAIAPPRLSPPRGG